MHRDGSRVTMHPLEVKGKWITRRRAAFAALIAWYVFAPLITVGGKPMVQLDVQHRRFFLFGSTFNAQDFWMVLLLVLSFAFALLFVTAWRGRVWCGWACPQTVFLEGVYRPIERFWDGPRERRLKRAQEPWSAKKVFTTLGKYASYFVVSLAIAHAATAIFVSPRELYQMIIEGPMAHLEAFLLSSAFAVIMVLNFTWFREQFCVVLCPYGRLQSVLHDRDSVVIAYLEKRGEPRGKFQKNPAPEAPRVGDCIDCKKCVHACPTGIDIRDGLQMECLGCHQCQDACDEVMVKVGRAPGLIGFASQAETQTGTRQVVRPRLFIYGVLFALAFGALGISLAVRRPFESNILRPRGSQPFFLQGSVVSNAFELHLVNKNPEPSTFHIKVTTSVPAQVIVGTPEVQVPSLSDVRVPVSVSIESAEIKGPVDLDVQIDDDFSGQTRHQTARFLSPMGLGH
jgi:cytochrome c oxidase accessory protein FixG